MTAILTTAVVGALLLQLNLLSGELELQRQHFESSVGQTANEMNEVVRLYVRKKSLGVPMLSQGNTDSTVTLQTPMGTTTLRWSSAQIQNPYGFGLDSTMLGGIMNTFQEAMPWEAQLSVNELDSLLKMELRAHNVRTKPQWAVAENGYLTSLMSPSFQVNEVSFNYVLEESFFGPTRQLLLYFPSEHLYLAKRVYLSLLASLLFSAVILFAFFGVSRQSRRQKRLAEVKSDFINNMSHEFKTPLATINLAVDTLMKNAAKMNDGQIQEYLGIIKTENKRMNAQMESVLQMSMMDKEELTLDLKLVQLDALIKECVDHFKLTVAERNGWIDLSIQTGNYLTSADFTQLKSAWTNLIDNGIKYTEGAPEISVQLKELDHSYEITFKDRGIGMDEEVQHQVFDQFFRATKGNIHDVKGHGLGLAFVKEIIEKHGGSIQLESEVGKGSTFTVELPKSN